MNIDKKPDADLTAIIASIAAAPFAQGLRLTVVPEHPGLPVDYGTPIVGVSACAGEDGKVSLTLTADNGLEGRCTFARQVADAAQRMLSGDACADEREPIRTAAALVADRLEHLDGRSALAAMADLAPYWQRAAHAARRLLVSGDRD